MKVNFGFTPKTFIRVLYILSFAFLAASLVVNFWGHFRDVDNYWFLTHNFDFEEKDNLPQMFKSLLLMFCGLAIFLNARAESKSGGASVGRWWALGAIFVAMAVDEQVQIHQKTVSLFIAWMMNVDVDKAENAKVFWLVPYLIFTTIFCVAYLGFWWKLPSRVRALFAAAGVTYVGGAAIVEEIAHHYAKNHGDTDVTYLLLTNFSEWMQMIGSILFLKALLLFLSRGRQQAAVQIEFGGPVEAGAGEE